MRSFPLFRPLLPFAGAILLAAPALPLGAEPQAAPPAPVPAPVQDRPAIPESSDQQAPDPMPTPPGTPADQALWRRAVDDSNGLAIAKVAAAKAQWRARNGKYDVRTAERAKALSGTEAERFLKIGKRVTAAWNQSYDMSASRWPVDATRGCQYPAQLLESAMLVAPGPERSALLAAARGDVNRCVEAAGLILKRMDRATQELEKAIAEADAALAPAVAPTPSPAAK